MQSLKRFTAREANKILNRNGTFWQAESYDHIVRNGEELKNIIAYTLENPVKAGLIDDWRKWEFSFVNNDYL